MNGGKKYRYLIVTACLPVFSCGLFNSGKPLRQCYREGTLKVVLRNESATEVSLYVYDKGEQVYTQDLRPYAPVVTGVVKDTIYLKYFGSGEVTPTDGLERAGRLWLNWKAYPRQRLTESGAINAVQARINNGRLELTPGGAGIRLSFALNNIVLENGRLATFAHSILKSSRREIRLPEKEMKSFLKAFEAYGKARADGER